MSLNYYGATSNQFLNWKFWQLGISPGCFCHVLVTSSVTRGVTPCLPLRGRTSALGQGSDTSYAHSDGVAIGGSKGEATWCKSLARPGDPSPEEHGERFWSEKIGAEQNTSATRERSRSLIGYRKAACTSSSLLFFGHSPRFFFNPSLSLTLWTINAHARKLALAMIAFCRTRASNPSRYTIHIAATRAAWAFPRSEKKRAPLCSANSTFRGIERCARARSVLYGSCPLERNAGRASGVEELVEGMAFLLLY